MAHFYGTVQGARGPTSRLGHHELYVTAQSFEGDIIVVLQRTDAGDMMELRVRTHGHSSSECLYRGFVKDLLDMEYRAAQMHALGVQKFIEGSKGER